MPFDKSLFHFRDIGGKIFVLYHPKGTWASIHNITIGRKLNVRYFQGSYSQWCYASVKRYKSPSVCMHRWCHTCLLQVQSDSCFKRAHGKWSKILRCSDNIPNHILLVFYVVICCSFFRLKCLHIFHCFLAFFLLHKCSHGNITSESIKVLWKLVLVETTLSVFEQKSFEIKIRK